MKRTIYFISVAILIVLGVTKSSLTSAQGNGNSEFVDRAVPMITTENYYYSPLMDRTIPVICDGIEVDRLSGTLDVFCRMFGHYNPLNPTVFVTQWMIHNYSGSLVGTSGEVFDIQGAKKIDSIDKVYTWHLNIKGDRGSHYILFASGVTSPFIITIEKAVCN